MCLEGSVFLSVATRSGKNTLEHALRTAISSEKKRTTSDMLGLGFLAPDVHWEAARNVRWRPSLFRELWLHPSAWPLHAGAMNICITPNIAHQEASTTSFVVSFGFVNFYARDRHTQRQNRVDKDKLPPLRVMHTVADTGDNEDRLKP